MRIRWWRPKRKPVTFTGTVPVKVVLKPDIAASLERGRAQEAEWDST